MKIFKTLNMITIEEKDTQIEQFKQMVIERDEINYLLMEKIDKLEKQARKSICESCVALTNQAHDQDCIIEDLQDALKAQLLKDNQSTVDSLIKESYHNAEYIEELQDIIKRLTALQEV
jgi:hypothetical protein